jgi:ankyrin repeat protein
MHDEKPSQEMLDRSLLTALKNVAADPQPADRVLEAVQVCLAQGASANAVDVDVDGEQCSAIHLAAGNYKDARIAELLIKHGANVHVVNKSGKTPLHYAAGSSSPAVAMALIDAGASITALDSCGSRASDFAAIVNEDPEMFELFIELGADVLPNATAEGRRLLQLAKIKIAAKKLQQLLKAL